MRLLIKNGRLIDPANGVDATADLAIADGKVVAVGKSPSGFTADRQIDATGQIVCPGFVELRARLREPGQEHKATIASETAAAAASGITTLCCPPDTAPIIDTPAVAELIYQRAASARKARVVCMGALTTGLEGKMIGEMKALAEAGCVGMSNGYKPVRDTLVMRRAMEYAAGHGLTVFLHAEDAWLRAGALGHEGAVSTRMGISGVPDFAESIAVARELALIEHSGVRAHFCGLSTARAVSMIAQAQADGLPVTADVTAHHLHLTEMDLAGFNAECHVRPPLRAQRDRDGLRAGLRAGTVSAISSDHQPHDLDAKLGPLAETEPGLSGLETLLPLALRLVEDRVLSLPQMIAALTQHPADILRLPVGRLGVGGPADVVVFDPQMRWTLSTSEMHSRGRNTPFAGWEFLGRVTNTLLDGQIVYSAN